VLQYLIISHSAFNALMKNLFITCAGTLKKIEMRKVLDSKKLQILTKLLKQFSGKFTKLSLLDIASNEKYDNNTF
jgi:hypothetical protein